MEDRGRDLLMENPDHTPLEVPHLEEESRGKRHRFKHIQHVKRVLKHLRYPAVPVVGYLKAYKDVRAIGQDVLGGVTVGVFLIPQGLALATLAGLPAQLGLYTSMIAPLVYAFFTTSPHSSIGPATMIAMFVAEVIREPSLTENEFNGHADAVTVCVLLTFLVGALQALAAFFGMGMLVALLSDSVVTAFGTAVALKLIIQQVPPLLGLPSLSSSDLHFALYEIVIRLMDADLSTLWSAIMGISVILILLYTRKIFKRLPAWVPLQLILMVICILITWLGRLDLHGLKILGEVPSGLPMPVLPSFTAIPDYISAASMLAIISYMQHIAVVKVLAKKLKYTVSPNQELFSSGLANVASAFFGAMPTCGGPARSLLNVSIGVRTPLSGLFSGITVLLCAAFLTPYLWYLPKPCLAGIIVAAGYSSLDFKEPWSLWKEYPEDTVTWCTTFLVTSFLGIQLGLGISIAISWLLAVRFLTIPRHSVLCYNPDMADMTVHGSFMGTAAGGTGQDTLPGDILLWRFDSPIFFANAQMMKDIVQKLVKKHHPRYFILDARAIVKIDAAAGSALKDVAEYLKEQKVTFLISNLLPRVQRRMGSKLVELIGANMITEDDNDTCLDWCHEHRRSAEDTSHVDPQSPVLSKVPTLPSLRSPASGSSLRVSRPQLRTFEATSSRLSESESESEGETGDALAQSVGRLEKLQSMFVAPCQIR
eukprot:GGOE01036840.1.p1 GENE.GGOE01036840.1~~GGOE01036840.1.p1  ORF type:complete len:708 (-),score=181.11 GGOE01036840.1:206-2329(-)